MFNCLWNDEAETHRYHLASWKMVTMKKEFGGLGVPDLRELNLCLMASWISRCSRGDGKIWKALIDFKYNTNNPNILSCREVGASNFWQGVMWAARVAKLGYR
jgi:hypothetical protein